MEFKELYDSYAEFVFDLSYKLLCNRSDAEDVTQEAFIKIFNKFDTFREESQLKTWIYSIVLNTCKDFIRKKKKQKNIAKAALEYFASFKNASTFESNVIEKLTSDQWLEQVYSNLPEKYRVSLILKEVEQLSNEEICQMLKIPLNTLKTRLKRGKKKLISILKEKGLVDAK